MEPHCVVLDTAWNVLRSHFGQIVNCHDNCFYPYFDPDDPVQQSSGPIAARNDIADLQTVWFQAPAAV